MSYTNRSRIFLKHVDDNVLIKILRQKNRKRVKPVDRQSLVMFLKALF